MRYLTSSIRAFSSSSGMFRTSSSVSPSSLLPKMTPTLHTPAFTPSLMSEIVSYREAGRNGEVAHILINHIRCRASGGQVVRGDAIVYLVSLLGGGRDDDVHHLLGISCGGAYQDAHATQGVDGFHYMRYRTRIVAQGAEGTGHGFLQSWSAPCGHVFRRRSLRVPAYGSFR